VALGYCRPIFNSDCSTPLDLCREVEKKYVRGKVRLTRGGSFIPAKLVGCANIYAGFTAREGPEAYVSAFL